MSGSEIEYSSLSFERDLARECDVKPLVIRITETPMISGLNAFARRPVLSLSNGAFIGT
jgi:hypothetical protein